MISETVAQLIISVLAGTVAGGLTNHIAVWMLFHPYERRFGFQGAIPKNKDRLARSLGKTVGERLLTPDDLLKELAASGVREALDDRIAELVADLLNTERGSVADMLPADTVEKLRGTLAEVADSIAAEAERYLGSADFEDQIRRFVVRARADVSSKQLGELLSPEQRSSMAARARSWAADFSKSPDLETGVRSYLSRHAARIAESREPMISRVPPAALSAIEGAIENYLPLAAAKLGNFLSHPASRDRIREALHDLFRKLVKDLEFHQRLIARIMITERTFDAALDALERDGVEQIAALLEDDNVRSELTRVLREAIISFLSKPFSDVVGDDSGERIESLAASAGDYLLRVLRDEGTHGFMEARLSDILESAERRTVGDLLGAVSDDAVVTWVSAAARSPRARRFVHDGVQQALARAITMRIGKPSRFLPDDAAPRLAAVLSPAIWEFAQARLPALVEQLDVQSMVERKVRGFSIQRMEELIRGVTERELRLIVKIGYLLGAVIGLISFGVARAFS